MSNRIVIAGGGTGGHIFPAIAIANALRARSAGVDILFVGAKGKMEMEKVPQAGYPIKGIDIAGFNRSSLIKNISLPFKLLRSFLQVRGILRNYRPDAVIGVGGYSSFPVLRYAQAIGIPTFIHESNSFAGKANSLLGRKAVKVFVAGEGMDKFFPPEKILVTGNPVRGNIVHSLVGRDEAIRSFGLDPALTTVLSTGGSLGAKGINEAIAAHIDAFAENGIQLIWQTGKPYAETAKTLCSGKRNVWTGDFIMKMENAFAAADIVISRSGAMSIAELCVVKKPVVFVPFPFAAEDHQTVNARRLVDKGAAWMIKDSEARDQLVSRVVELAKDEDRQEKLRENIGKLAVVDADSVIARSVLDFLGSGMVSCEL